MATLSKLEPSSGKTQPTAGSISTMPSKITDPIVGPVNTPISSSPVVTRPGPRQPFDPIEAANAPRDPVFSDLTDLRLTPRQGGIWGPYIEVIARDFPGIQFNVWRQWADRKVLVRPLVEVYAGPDIAARDYEAPFDVPITYTIEDFLGRVHATRTVTLESTTDMGWIHPVLNPSLAVQVDWMQQSFSKMVRPTTGSALYVQGASDPVIVNGGIRRGMTDMPLTFRVYSRAEEARVQRMLGGRSEPGRIRRAPTVFCLRTSGIVPLSGSTVVAMQEVQWERTENRSQYFFTDFTVSVTEAQPPAPGRRIEQLTYDVFQRRIANYDAFAIENPTYGDAQVNYTGIET